MPERCKLWWHCIYSLQLCHTRERIANMEKGMIARTLRLEVAYCALKEIRKILSLNLGDIVFPQVVKNQNCD